MPQFDSGEKGEQSIDEEAIKNPSNTGNPKRVFNIIKVDNF